MDGGHAKHGGHGMDSTLGTTATLRTKPDLRTNPTIRTNQGPGIVRAAAINRLALNQPALKPELNQSALNSAQAAGTPV
jgi:hypothetical protein